MMLAGLAMTALMGIALYFVASLWMAVIVMTLMGFGTILFVPAQQAFFGDNVPYAQRGRVMALAEISWSLSAIVGLPLVGILVQTQGWRVGYVAIGFFAILAIATIWFALPLENRNAHHASRAIAGSFLEALRAPMALAILTTTFLLAAANENMNIVFGAWMHTRFDLDAVALGFVASAIGGAELVGELTSAAFVDRVGKWRMVGGNLALSVLAYVLLPFIGTNAIYATGGLVITFFLFEVAVVSALPLISEIAPNVRATLLSLSVAGFSLGRATGSFVGPAVFANFGFTATSFVSAGGILLTCLIWFLFVREHA